MTCHTAATGFVGHGVTTSQHKPSPTPADHVRDAVVRLFCAVEERDATTYLESIYHAEVIIHESPALPYGGCYRGLVGVAQHAHAFLATWAPHQSAADRAMHAHIDAVADHAYVRWTLGASGRRFPMISHYRFRAGRIVESRMYPFDLVGLVTWWRRLRNDTTPGICAIEGKDDIDTRR